MKIIICTLLLFLSPGIVWADDLPFQACQKKLLSGKTIEDFISIEKESLGEDKESQYLNQLLKLKEQKNCETLLMHAKLADNGLLINRTPLASQILKTFDNFHTEWLTPVDLDRNPQCQDKYHDDFYDPQSPAYHLTRALFQETRKVSLATTAYGDLRVVTKGENPENSKSTGISKDRIKEILGLDNNFEFKGEGEVIGYLYQRRLKMTPPPLSHIAEKDSWKKEIQSKAFKVLDHLGAGLLGNSRFLVHYAPPEAYSNEIIRFDGNRKLPRRLAKAIVENLLCIPLNDHNLPFQEPPQSEDLWKHPLTMEKKCVNCHGILDPISAGLRHLTFIKSKKSCSDFQLLIPHFFQTQGNANIWSKNEENPFHTSLPVGYFGEKRFIGMSQLGKLISEQPEFFQCQVKKYFSFLTGKEIENTRLKSLAKKYQEHQNGIKLLGDIIRAMK